MEGEERRGGEGKGKEGTGRAGEGRGGNIMQFKTRPNEGDGKESEAREDERKKVRANLKEDSMGKGGIERGGVGGELRR